MTEQMMKLANCATFHNFGDKPCRKKSLLFGQAQQLALKLGFGLSPSYYNS